VIRRSGRSRSGLDEVEHGVEGGVGQPDLAGLRSTLQGDGVPVVGVVRGDLAAEPQGWREAGRLVLGVERDRDDVEGRWGHIAVDQGLAAADLHGGALVGGLARADVEQRVAMGARHLGPLLDALAVGAGSHEHEMADLTVDAHERGAARLRREVTLGDAGAAALLADQTHKGWRYEKPSNDAHTQPPSTFDSLRRPVATTSDSLRDYGKPCRNQGRPAMGAHGLTPRRAIRIVRGCRRA